MIDSKEKPFTCTFTLTFSEGTRVSKIYAGTSVDEVLDSLHANHVADGGGFSELYNTFLDKDGDVVNVTLTITPVMVPAYRQEQEQKRIMAEKQQKLDEELAAMIEQIGKEEVLARLKSYE